MGYMGDVGYPEDFAPLLRSKNREACYGGDAISVMAAIRKEEMGLVRDRPSRRRHIALSA